LLLLLHDLDHPRRHVGDLRQPEEILRQVNPWFILLTFLLGLVANLFPVSGIGLVLRPDFLALVILYWCIQEPRYVSVGIAWMLGLVMDVADATVFGQHALAYAILGFAAGYFHRRVLRFPLWQQALHVLGLLLVAQIVVLVLRLMSGAGMPNVIFLLSSFASALIWPLISALLQWPQRVRSLLD